MLSSSVSKLTTAIIFIVLLSGCSGKQMQPVPMSQDVWSSGGQKIGVVMTEMPKPDISYPGASCLLCVGVASAMHSTLSSYIDTLGTNELSSVTQDLSAAIQGRGQSALIIEKALDIEALPEFSSDLPNAPDQDFRSFAQEHGVTQLIVIDVDYVGFERQFSSYVPTNVPMAKVTGTAYMIDLVSNTYKWYHPISISQAAQGEWDEPDNFPGLTNAYYQAIEQTKELIRVPFKSAN